MSETSTPSQQGERYAGVLIFLAVVLIFGGLVYGIRKGLDEAYYTQPITPIELPEQEPGGAP
jgi:hypothetical protein